MTNDQQFNRKLHHKLLTKKMPSLVADINSQQSTTHLIKKTSPKIKILITSLEHPSIHAPIWENIIVTIAKKIPVLIIKENLILPIIQLQGTYTLNKTPNDIISLLQKNIDLKKTNGKTNKPPYFAIPYYHQTLTTNILKTQGYLSILSIHTPQFNQIATESGQTAFQTVHSCFQKILFKLWGSSGSFRLQDLLVQDRHNPNAYHIILTLPRRSDSYLPKPGELKKLSTRLKTNINNLLWEALHKRTKTNTLAGILKQVPEFYIGYATAIYNKNISISESVSQLLIEAEKSAHLQKINHLEKTKELIQFLIQSKKILTPYYQGIFNIKKITMKEIDDSTHKKTIRPLLKHLHGFESLIRINKKRATMLLGKELKNHINLKHLQPDLLFYLASLVNLNLELDQACLRQTLQQYKEIPGDLFVNILPRNYYIIDQFKQLIPTHLKLSFELSEKEVINNYGLIKEKRQQFSKERHTIAIDDFGKDFAGINRILKIKPDIIKIDRSLIHNIHQDLVKKEFIQGIIKATKEQATLLLAEGVENINEFKTLKKLGITLIQGFLLHKPQSHSTLSKLFKKK